MRQPWYEVGFHLCKGNTEVLPPASHAFRLSTLLGPNAERIPKPRHYTSPPYSAMAVPLASVLDYRQEGSVLLLGDFCDHTLMGALLGQGRTFDPTFVYPPLGGSKLPSTWAQRPRMVITSWLT